MSELNPYAPAIIDLHKRRQQIDQVIQFLESLRPGPQPAPVAASARPSVSKKRGVAGKRVKQAKVKKPPRTKVCPECEKEKPAEMFYANAQSSDGLASYCKDCFNQKYKR